MELLGLPCGFRGCCKQVMDLRAQTMDSCSSLREYQGISDEVSSARGTQSGIQFIRKDCGWPQLARVSH